MNKPTTPTHRKGRTKASAAKGKQQLPPGWNERKVRAVIAHYDHITDDELAAEIEKAAEAADEKLIAVPTALVAAVQKLIKEHVKRNKRHEKSA